jgi:hypothetical protein
MIRADLWGSSPVFAGEASGPADGPRLVLPSQHLSLASGRRVYLIVRILYTLLRRASTSSPASSPFFLSPSSFKLLTLASTFRLYPDASRVVAVPPGIMSPDDSGNVQETLKLYPSKSCSNTEVA